MNVFLGGFVVAPNPTGTMTVSIVARPGAAARVRKRALRDEPPKGAGSYLTLWSSFSQSGDLTGRLRRKRRKQL